jgi:hypothetical protein
MNNKTTLASLADIITASGHVGYQWDMITDQITWFGPWQIMFGPDRAAPPVNALEYSACIFTGRPPPDFQ